MSIPESAFLFPTPREASASDGYVYLSGNIRTHANEPQHGEAARLVRAALESVQGAPIASHDGAVPVNIGTPPEGASLPQHPEGYVLEIQGDGVHLAGSSPGGTVHGAHTLCQLIRQYGGRVPQLSIRDWPTMDHRGLFIECKWGPDRMTLSDWQEVVDTCAELKLNHLGVGVYGCWVVQYDGDLTEFLMVPLPTVPDAKTPKTIRYFSAEHGADESVSYVPPMFEQDFFGELISYGKQRGVSVRPQFNCLGHNTLIPRILSDISSRDEDGKPTGYGYCLTSRRTEEVVFAICEDIVTRYLRPNGITSFHIGLDEVWSSRGIDVLDPTRVVSPWCQCESCAKESREDLFIDWLSRLCDHLRSLGMREVAVWNDQFTRHMDLLTSEVSQKLQSRDLNQLLTIEWWQYRPNVKFSDLRPDMGLRTWVVPMTGYYHWWLYQDYLQNISGMLALGRRDGAVGTEAYGTYDPAFDRNYRYLAEWAWSPDGTTSSSEFRRKYATWLLGDGDASAMDIFDAAILRGDVFEEADVGESGEDKNEHVLEWLLPYRYTYVSPDLPYPRSYPQEALERLLCRPAEYSEQLREIECKARRARLALSQVEAARVPELVREYCAEALRIEVVASTFAGLLEIQGLSQSAASETGQQAAQHVSDLLARWETMMQAMETTKREYLLPQVLRELTPMHTYLASLSQRLANDPNWPLGGLTEFVAGPDPGGS